MASLIIIGLGWLCYTFFAQNNYSENQRNTIICKATDSTTEEVKKTKYIWRDSKGIEYPVYINSRGSCFIIKTSAKTGKKYMNYLGREISQQICKELGVDHKFLYDEE